MSDQTAAEEKGGKRPKVSKKTLEGFVEILTGVIPLLDNIKHAIEETSGKIPKASSQLNSVSKATESATVEILNVLDSISNKLTETESALHGLSSRRTEGLALAQQAMDRLASLAGTDPEVLALLAQWEEHKRPGELDDAVNRISGIILQTKEESMAIAMALQVQDITAQQIAGVSHMIESVRLRLTGIVENIQGENAPGTEAIAPPVEVPTQAFDTDAVFTRSTHRQESADEIVQQWTRTDQ